MRGPARSVRRISKSSVPCKSCRRPDFICRHSTTHCVESLRSGERRATVCIGCFDTLKKAPPRFSNPVHRAPVHAAADRGSVYDRQGKWRPNRYARACGESNPPTHQSPIIWRLLNSTPRGPLAAVFNPGLAPLDFLRESRSLFLAFAGSITRRPVGFHRTWPCQRPVNALDRT